MESLYGELYFKQLACRDDLIKDQAGNLFTTDGRIRFFKNEENVFAEVRSPRDLPVIYPVEQTLFKKPVKALLMDLDGTTIMSEEYWIEAIQEAVRRLTKQKAFTFTTEDLPHVAGYSTREHLDYCIKKYNIAISINQAVAVYAEVHEEWLRRIEHDSSELLKPNQGLKELLLTLKAKEIKVALVTAASERKAMLEIRSVFKQLELGDPFEFYDAIVTAGKTSSLTTPGTIGSLASKPHPWLYLEAARIGLGLNKEDRNQIVGVEDSAAGVVSLKLAGFPAIGVKGGNIVPSGLKPLLLEECSSLTELITLLEIA